MIFRIFFLFLLIPLAAFSADNIDSLAEKAVADNLTASAVILVKKDDTVLHFGAYGYADAGTVFDLASLTKPFATGLALMLLTDDGKIDVAKPVCAYLEEFCGEQKKNITVEQLLRHTAGLRRWIPVYYHAQDRESAIEYVLSLKPELPAGKQREYSDIGFMTLGILVERVSGQRLDKFLSGRLYSPLSLKKTGFLPLERYSKDIAPTSVGNSFEKHMIADDDFGYKCDEDFNSSTGWRPHLLRGEVNDGNAGMAFGGVAGHAGLFSDAYGLAVLGGILMHGGSGIIRPETVKMFLTADDFGGGLSWMMDEDMLKAYGMPEGSFGHTGFTGASAVFVPSMKLSVIILTNRQMMGVDSKGYYPNLSSFRQAVFSEALLLGKEAQ
jgi:CubicO group peptidase (beta-lactamase class C family)